MDYGHIVDVHSKFVRSNLRERSFLTLPMRGRASENRNLSGRLDAHGRALPTPGRHRLRWAKRADLHVTRQSDSDQLTLSPCFVLFFAQLSIARKIESF